MLGSDGGFVLACQHFTGLDDRLILDVEFPVLGYAVLIVDHFCVFDLHFAQVGIFIGLQDVHDAVDLRHDRFAFRHFACFEQFFHARQTGRDVHGGGSYTTGMEGAQCELRAGLADRLGGYDPDGCAQVDHVASAEVESIAFCTDAVLEFTGQRRANLDFGNAGSRDLARQDVIDYIVTFGDDLAGFRVDHPVGQQAAVQAYGHRLSSHVV